MSEISKRGKDFELKVAKMLRLKIDKAAQRNKGSHANWNRNSDIYTELPYHIEAKDHETLKIKEWFRQADEAAFGKTPVVAWQMGNEVMATLRFDDLVNLFVEVADLRAEIADLRAPKKMHPAHDVTLVRQGDLHIGFESKSLITDPKPLFKFTDGTLKREVVFCKNGHICNPGNTQCQTKGCQFSVTYVKPRAKDKDKK